VVDLIRHVPRLQRGPAAQACQLFVDKMLEKDVTVGLTMTGALTRRARDGA
jgi:hypothetical protein